MRAGYKPRSFDWGIFSWPEGGPEYLGIPATACDLKEEAATAILAGWKGYYKIVPSLAESGSSGLAGSARSEKLTWIHPKTGAVYDEHGLVRHNGTRECTGAPLMRHAGPTSVHIHTFTSVHINDGSMSFSGGSGGVLLGEKQMGVDSNGRSLNPGIQKTRFEPYIQENPAVAFKLALRRGVDGELYLDNLGSRVIEDSPTELKIKMFQGGEYSLVRTSDRPA